MNSENAQATAKVNYKRINATQVTLFIEGYDKTLLLTFVPGWDGGGNNYRSAKWCIGLPNQFMMKSFPAGRNNLGSMPKTLIEYVIDYIQS